MKFKFWAVLLTAVFCFAEEPSAPLPSLDLVKLRTQDSEDFEEYSRRIEVVEDSVAVLEKQLQEKLALAADSLPPLAPKAEFETDSAFEARSRQYELDVHKAARQKEEAGLLMNRLGELKATANTIKKIQMGMLSSLLVKTTPEQASVQISSQNITLKSPAQFEQVKPGDVEVSVFMDGYVPSHMPIVLKSHENREMEVTLVPEAALADAAEDASKSAGWTWRGYARISALVAAAGFFGAGVFENVKAADIADEYNGHEVRLQKAYDKAKKSIDRRETLRNVYYGIAGAFTLLGTLTFFF